MKSKSEYVNIEKKSSKRSCPCRPKISKRKVVVVLVFLPKPAIFLRTYVVKCIRESNKNLGRNIIRFIRRRRRRRHRETSRTGVYAGAQIRVIIAYVRMTCRKRTTSTTAIYVPVGAERRVFNYEDGENKKTSLRGRQRRASTRDIVMFIYGARNKNIKATGRFNDAAAFVRRVCNIHVITNNVTHARFVHAQFKTTPPRRTYIPFNNRRFTTRT